MIRSFGDKRTEELFDREPVKRIPKELQRAALRKLLIIDAAQTLEDLDTPPGNRLEKLKGDRKQQFSIRINQQWRICFEWADGDAFEVEIVDYH